MATIRDHYRLKSDAKRAAKTYRTSRGYKARIRKAAGGGYEVIAGPRLNPSKRRTRKRVAKSFSKFMKAGGLSAHSQFKRMPDGTFKKISNPGRKVKGGRAISLKNFTGRVIRKSNGQVIIAGKGKHA